MQVLSIFMCGKEVSVSVLPFNRIFSYEKKKSFRHQSIHQWPFPISLKNTFRLVFLTSDTDYQSHKTNHSISTFLCCWAAQTWFSPISTLIFLSICQVHFAWLVLFLQSHNPVPALIHPVMSLWAELTNG